MSKKKVYNKEEIAKSEQIKGSTRSSVALDMLQNTKSQTMVDRKKHQKSGGKSKYKPDYK